MGVNGLICDGFDCSSSGANTDRTTCRGVRACIACTRDVRLLRFCVSIEWLAAVIIYKLHASKTAAETHGLPPHTHQLLSYSVLILTDPVRFFHRVGFLPAMNDFNDYADCTRLYAAAILSKNCEETTHYRHPML